MSFFIFFFVIFMIVLIFAILWGWTMFLDEARPTNVRTWLYATLFLVTISEFVIWYWDATKPWLMVPVLICNIWGMYDAIARFPIVHDVDSFFTLKEIVLVAGKTLGYSLGFRNIGRLAGWFLLCLFVNVWFVPLMYLMALPIGDLQVQNARSDVIDDDLFIRLYGFRKREQRAMYMRKLVRSFEGTLIFLGRSIPFLGQRLERDPKYRRLLRKGPQV